MEFIQRVIHALTELHPTHPMFVHFPIALTGAAFLFILLAYWRKSVSLEQTAFANIALASVATIAAGITGYLDNIKNYVGEAPNASTKIILAITLFIPPQDMPSQGLFFEPCFNFWYNPVAQNKERSRSPV